MRVHEVHAIAYAAGIDDGLFWNSTPAETRCIMTELRKREDHRTAMENYRTGLLASLIVNFGFKKADKSYQPHDFFGNLPTSEHETDTPDALRNTMLAWASITPGVRVN